jgi:hypothetical protein
MSSVSRLYTTSHKYTFIYHSVHITISPSHYKTIENGGFDTEEPREGGLDLAIIIIIFYYRGGNIDEVTKEFQTTESEEQSNKGQPESYRKVAEKGKEKQTDV